MNKQNTTLFSVKLDLLKNINLIFGQARNKYHQLLYF